MKISKINFQTDTKRIPSSKNKNFIERRKIIRRENSCEIDFPERRFFERRKIVERRTKDHRGNNLPIDFPERRRSERRNVIWEDYSTEFINVRREWLSKQTNAKLTHIGNFSFDPQKTRSNIENLIGATQIPIGICGPLRIYGEYAKGDFYIPMATTEGTLIDGYQQGVYAITKSGGANATVIKDSMNISPVFILQNISEVNKFIFWLNENFKYIKEESEKTTAHGKLINITPFSTGRRVILNFCFSTGDAMGLNMVNIAVDQACKYIIKNAKVEKYYLRCNFSSDKKASFFNLITSYGKEVLVEVTLPRKILKRLFGISSTEAYDFWYSGVNRRRSCRYYRNKWTAC